jgi:hypothetical protein
MQQQKPSTALDRRKFLIAASTVFGAAPEVVAQAGSPGILLQRGTRNLYRVRMEIEMKGNVNVPRNPLISREQMLKLPISSQASFDYEERLRSASGNEQGQAADEASEKVVDQRKSLTAERYYHRAKAESTLNETRHSVELRDSVRDTVVRHDSLPEQIYGVEDFFERDELELLHTPVSSMAIDQLLPSNPISAGSTYDISADSMASVLNLTAAMACNVKAEIVAISDDEVRIQFQGNVDGAIDGVPTAIRSIGKLTFNRKLKSCNWLAMALHEIRDIGRAEPGFDVTATIRILRQPLEATIALPAVARKIDVSKHFAANLQHVSVTSEKLGFHVLMDRRWRMMRDQPTAAMMRMVENDRSIGQCDIKTVSKSTDGEPWSLPTFESNVQILLGEQFVEMVESDEQTAASGIRILRAVANGSAEGVPIRWIVMFLSDNLGKQVVATFTMEGSNIDTFGGSDMQFASSIRFTESDSDSQPTKKSAQNTLNSRDKDMSQQVDDNTPKHIADSISNANSVR